jgi:tetratricopeptide (TPR) repeat protein
MSGHLAQSNAWLLQALELDQPLNQRSKKTEHLLQQYRLKNNQHWQHTTPSLPAQGRNTLQRLSVVVATNRINTRGPVDYRQDNAITTNVTTPLQQWESTHLVQRQQAAMAMAMQDTSKAMTLYQALWEQLPLPSTLASTHTVVSATTINHIAVMLTFLGQNTLDNHPIERLLGLKIAPLSDTVKLCQLALQQSSKSKTLVNTDAFKPFSSSPDPWVAGLALWLQDKRSEAIDQWDSIDGRTPTGYLQLAEALTALKAYALAQTMALRGLELSNDGSAEDTQALAVLNTWQQHLKINKAKAQTQVFLGNTLFVNKQYADAKRAYLEANTLSPTWDTPYLRLGELYEKLKSPSEALLAYTHAIELTPALMDSKLFSKKMAKLKVKVIVNKQ